MADEGESTTQDIFDRTLPTTANFRGLHRVGDETLEENAQYVTHQLTWEGAYDACKATFDAYFTNQLVCGPAASSGGVDTFIKTDGSNTIDGILVNKSLRQASGGRGRVTFTIKGYKRVYEGNLDFERIDKDIRTWRALCTQNQPELEKILLWEQTKDTGRVDLYGEYKYIDKNGAVQSIATGTATRALAEMMYRGVESFPEFIPVLNLTITFAKHPVDLNIEGFKTGGLLGKAVQYSDILPSGWSLPIGNDSAANGPEQEFETLDGDYTLCTADKLQNNSDGTYTLIRAFSKFRLIEKELYLGVSGASFGPYDASNPTS